MNLKSPKHAVLVGAGHAHLHVIASAEDFRRRGHKLTVIAPDAFWYSGLATGMVGGLYPPELDRIDVAALASRHGARFVQDRVVGLDPQARRVLLERHAPVPFDALSLTLGSAPPELPGPDQPGVYSVKPISRLRHLRDDLEARFRAGSPVRVVIGGAGATAAELAANIAALAARSHADVDIVVLASGSSALRQLPGRAGLSVRNRLQARGVSFRSESRVTRLEEGRAVLEDGRQVAFDIFLNATGLKPAPILKQFGLPLDAEGALILDTFLRSPADPAIHGGSDCIALAGHALPRIGVHAIRQAPILLHNLIAALDGTAPRRFEPQRRYLWIMNLGDGTGVAMRGRLWWPGRAAFLLKDWIDRRFLSSYRPG